MSFGDVVDSLAKPRVVVRRGELEYDGTSPRPTGAPVETTAIVSLAIQRVGDGIQLERQVDGDQTGGRIRVWGSTEAFAAAFEQDDEDEVALDWTGLQIAPTEDADGPPGDIVNFEGRRFEVVAEIGWADFFDDEPAGFRRYVAEERGASS